MIGVLAIVSILVCGSSFDVVVRASSNLFVNMPRLPDFNGITGATFAAGMPQLLDTAETEFAKLENDLNSKLKAKDESQITWDGVIGNIERIFQPTFKAWVVTDSLMLAKSSGSLRAAVIKVARRYKEMTTKRDQSQVLFNAYKVLQKQDLDSTQRRVIKTMLRKAEMAGFALSNIKKIEFQRINAKLSTFASEYRANAMNARGTFELLVTDKAKVAGCAANLLQAGAQNAAKKGESGDPVNGPWKFTDKHSRIIRSSCSNRDIRKEISKANIASSGKYSNVENIESIRNLRRESAEQLGFATYADKTLQGAILGSAEQAQKFVEKYRERMVSGAKKETEVIKEFAVDKGYLQTDDKVQDWDFGYIKKKLMKEKYSAQASKVPEYFPLPTVLQGIFKFIKLLFQVDIKEVKEIDGVKVPVWDDAVQYFDVRDSGNGKYIGSFYADFYARGKKKWGSWTYGLEGRSDVLKITPWCVLVTNFNAPSVSLPNNGGDVSLLSLTEVDKLFHELAHVLQNLMTTVPFYHATGMRYIEGDGVEVASMFFANFAYDPVVLDMISGHYQNGNKLPKELYKMAMKGKSLGQSTFLLGQFKLAAFDQRIYGSDKRRWEVILKEVAAKYSYMEDDSKWPCHFVHIFGMGYGAKYYGYYLSEVIASDIYGAFLEGGKANFPVIGKKFRMTYLEEGDSKHAMEVYKEFRGKTEPDVKYLLKKYGIEN